MKGRAQLEKQNIAGGSREEGVSLEPNIIPIRARYIFGLKPRNVFGEFFDFAQN